MTGPFETEREARELAAVQAIYEAFRNDPGVGRMTPHVHRMLVEACAAAGVQLGAYDRRVLAWLAGWEPQTAAVVAGLISRANTTAAAPAPETRMVGEVRAVLAAFDWECGDRQLALDAIDRIVLAGAGPAPAEGGPRRHLPTRWRSPLSSSPPSSGPWRTPRRSGCARRMSFAVTARPARPARAGSTSAILMPPRRTTTSPASSAVAGEHRHGHV